MTDVFTKEKRSSVMAQIRGKGNKTTEMSLISILRRGGVRGWRRQQTVYGRPDFVFWATKTAVFVDGCFWHGCSKHATIPKNNRAFWTKKMIANKTRDKKVSDLLRKKGWNVIRIWEHDLKREQYCLQKIIKAGSVGVPKTLSKNKG